MSEGTDRRPRRRALLAVVVTLSVVPSVPVTASGSLLDPTVLSATAACDPANPALAGPPGGIPEVPIEPVVVDGNGNRTVTLLVEEPPFPTPRAYLGTPEAGIYLRQWLVDRPMTTLGVYQVAPDETITHVPVAVIENVLYAELIALVTALNTLPYALNTVAPTGAGFAVDPLLFEIWTSHRNGYPALDGYADFAPAYVWSVFRRAGEQQVWSGSVLMRNGWSSVSTAGGVTRREGCARTRLGHVARENSGTTYLGGAYALDHVRGSDGAGRFEGKQTLIAGPTVGTEPVWTDLPGAAAHQSQLKRGDGQYVYYPDEQRDEIRLGVHVDGAFVPLIGTRADARHGPPDRQEDVFGSQWPARSQERLVSVGVYGPGEEYVPVAGVRQRFARWPVDLWVAAWTATGGPGSAHVGNWQTDVGIFDPTGGFVPLAGATYQDSFQGGVHPYRMLITAGPWAADTYVPLIGVSYDGSAPLLDWMLASGSHPSHDGGWLAAVGTFSPDGGYVALLGVVAKRSGSGTGSVRETYRVGPFAPYPEQIPLAGADWRSDRSSAIWLAGWSPAVQTDIPPNPEQPPVVWMPKAPSDAQVDVGPSLPDGTLVPVAGVRVTAGAPDRYTFGAWAADTFAPVAEVCVSAGTVPEGGAVGVAASGGESRIPLAWFGRGAYGIADDCPA